MQTKFWLEKMKERDNLEDIHIDGKIILDWILEKERCELDTSDHSSNLSQALVKKIMNL